MKDRTLGWSGASSDEINTEYILRDGKLILRCWGNETTEDPAFAAAALDRQADVSREQAAVVGPFSADPARESAARRAAAAIRAAFRLADPAAERISPPADASELRRADIGPGRTSYRAAGGLSAPGMRPWICPSARASEAGRRPPRPGKRRENACAGELMRPDPTPDPAGRSGRVFLSIRSEARSMIRRVIDNRRFDSQGKPLKWCPRCGWKRLDAFGRNAARSDGLAAHCRRCMAQARRGERSMDRQELARLIEREQVTDPAALEAWDQRERRREIHRMGLATVYDIRRRLDAVRRLKSERHGEVLSDDELDRVADPIDCARSRARLEKRA